MEINSERRDTIRPLNSKPLDSLLEFAAQPSAADCGAVVEQAITLLEQAYVSLPDKRLHGIDPVERLKQLRLKLPSSVTEFYREMLLIFGALGDRHTYCHLPEPFARQVAFLPFGVKEFFENGQRQLAVVESAIEGLSRGDRVVSWNDRPVTEEIEMRSRAQLGANTEARRARAVLTLTFRPLAWVPLPEEDVMVECVSDTGRRHKARLKWQVAEMSSLGEQFGSIFDKEEKDGNRCRDTFRSRVIQTAAGTFGYIQVLSFHDHPEAFLLPFAKALEAMPEEGLILDLRGCKDGIIPTAEQLLQLFTSETIEPEPFQFRVTDLIRKIARRNTALDQWRASIEQAARRGETFSEWFPITPIEKANSIGQKYRGQVAVIVDALTYSSAEMFAAGMQDHGIAAVVGTAHCTGGGGASTWHQSAISRLSGDESFLPLTDAPSFRVAVRRCRRVRARSNQLIEGVGVSPDIMHLPTRADLLCEDADLLGMVTKFLAEKWNQGYIGSSA